jgi:hypothetical protein
LPAESACPTNVTAGLSTGWQAKACPTFLLLGWLAVSTAGAAVPRYAFSVPAGESANASACQVKTTIAVLPAVAFRLGEEVPAGLFTQQTSAAGAAREGASVYLHVRIAAGALTGRETEAVLAARVNALLRQAPLSAAAVAGIIAEVEEPAAMVDQYGFGLVNFAVAAKGAKPDLQLVFQLPTGFTGRHGDLVKRLATYADSLGLSESAGWKEEAAWIAAQAFNKPLVLKPAGTGGAGYLGATLATLESAVETIWMQPVDGKALAESCTANDTINKFVTPVFSPVPAAQTMGITVEGGAPRQIQWFSSSNSPDVVAIVLTGASAGSSKSVRLQGNLSGKFEAQWVDVLTGAGLKPGELSRSGAAITQTGQATGEYLLIFLHKTDESEDKVFTALEVKGRVDLTVAEIIARWQQYQAAQKRKLLHYIADCFTNLHFENAGMGSGFDISLNFKQFANDAGLIEWVQTQFFVNGVKFSNRREFPMAQMEPEKVMTQPLELKMDEKYEYKLAGTEQVNGVFCYVVDVTPRNRTENLFSGKVWIDGTTFRQVREVLSQRGGKEGNIVSNTETQDFSLFQDASGGSFNLIKSIYAQQRLNAAGRDFVLQKTYRFDSYAINGPGFDEALSAAWHSDDPMFRETDQGLRSLRKKGEERVVDAKSVKRVRSLVGGMMYEGSYSFPIPFAGISVVDFDFRHTGSQLSVFFAGPILAVNLSKPVSERVRVGIDVALSGLPGNDRIYSGNTELKSQTLWNWREDTGLRATWQATTALSFTAASYFSYEFYRGNSDTDKAYVLPRNGMTLLPTLEMKWAEKGYIFGADVTRGQRLGWTSFGLPGQLEKTSAGFTKYSSTFDKTVYIGKFTKATADFSYYGGNQLDRFSRYQPSFFSRPRIHGLPNGYDMFDAVAIGSVSYGFDILNFIKFDGMYSYARARDTFESRYFKKFDGLESNFGTAGPWGTYIQGTVDYGLHGNTGRYDSRWGVYIMVFKPLR